MIESSDTGQASIVFMGRDSFRMQVTDAGAVPTTLWEGGTARVIERRKNDRRQARRVAPAPQAESPAPMPARNTIIGIALMTFACGVMVATAMNQFPMRGGLTVQAAAPTPAPRAPTAIVQPLAKQAPAPAPVAAPVTASVTAPIPAAAPPEVDPQPETRSVVAKVRPAAHAVTARAARPRRPAPSRSTTATAAGGNEAPPAAPRPARQWVDPFAD